MFEEGKARRRRRRKNDGSGRKEDCLRRMIGEKGKRFFLFSQYCMAWCFVHSIGWIYEIETKGEYVFVRAARFSRIAKTRAERCPARLELQMQFELNCPCLLPRLSTAAQPSQRKPSRNSHDVLETPTL